MLKPEVKRNAVKRWALSDRTFFACGACHILAGTFLREQPLPGFYALRIIPTDDKVGNHIFCTNGDISFDYRGYAALQRVLEYHRIGWLKHHMGEWDCAVERVDFDLLDTNQLNLRKMLGPDQYFGDPVRRAQQMLSRIEHQNCSMRAYNTIRKQEAT